MTALFRLLVLCVLLGLLLRVALALDTSCEEGDIDLGKGAPSNNAYRLLKVCLFGNWSYVCHDSKFNYIDRSIVLNQLGCDGGTTKNVTANNTPVYLTNINCFGVERKVMDCRHAQLLDRTSSCNGRVAVNCSKAMTAMRICENGELRRNETNKVLNICYNGTWVPLCPYLWQSSAQAMVACRQLYPNKIVIGSKLTTINDTAANLFRHFYYCTGNEKNLTDCTISWVNQNFFRNQICKSASNKLVGIDCETAEIINTATTVTLVSTIVQQVYQSCSEFINASPVVSAASSSPLPWVGGIVTGAILSAAILFIVFAIIVFLLRRKPKPQRKRLDNTLNTERTDQLSASVGNEVYNNGSTVQPQTYEQFQPINKPNESEYSCIESEYSYATHAVNTNVYDSVPHQNNENTPTKETYDMPVLDNSALYSMCEEAELPAQKV